MIEVQDLCKTFSDPKRGTRLAVDHVSFTVRNGEVFGLLGPNGAGKTTTLRVLATLLKASSGTARLNGCDINTEPEKVREQIGFLSGDMGLYARLTPREILNFFGQLNGMDTARLKSRIHELTTAVRDDQLRRRAYRQALDRYEAEDRDRAHHAARSSDSDSRRAYLGASTSPPRVPSKPPSWTPSAPANASSIRPTSWRKRNIFAIASALSATAK
jgi:ABC-type glutathione transport system ATPase component